MTSTKPSQITNWCLQYFSISRRLWRLWKNGILINLHYLGLHGQLPLFFYKALWHIQPFRCVFILDGSVLSVLLYTGCFDNIVSGISLAKRSLFVDDLAPYTTVTKLPCLERRFRTTIRKSLIGVTNMAYIFPLGSPSLILFRKKGTKGTSGFISNSNSEWFSNTKQTDCKIALPSPRWFS